MGNIKSLEKLIGSFMMLPGVGYKTAQRYAYSILSSDREKVQTLAESMMAAKDNIRFCNRCGNFSEEEYCEIGHVKQSNGTIVHQNVWYCNLYYKEQDFCKWINRNGDNTELIIVYTRPMLQFLQKHH